MKILLRYLFVSLLKAFAFCMLACLTLFFIFDLFNSLDEFIQNRHLILPYYEALLPGMVLMILPVAVLFATLYTLLDLNRTSQIVAMQACGIGLPTIFAPFLILGLAGTVTLYFLTLGPGGNARARQNALMAEMRAKPGSEGISSAQVYRNHDAHRTWYLQTLSLRDNVATGIDVCEQDASGKDTREIFARQGEWNGRSWTFSDALVETFDAQGNVATRQIYDHLPLPDWSDTPQAMVRVLLRPEEMGLRELRQTLREPELAPQRVSQYQTQVDYLFVYPWAAVVLILFALPQGVQYGRRHVGAGVFNAIFLLIAFYFIWNFFLALGRGGRLSGWAAVTIPMLGFTLVALFRLLPMIGFHLRPSWWLHPSRLPWTSK